MGQHLQREIEHIKKMLLTLGAMVEERVREAVKSIHDRDTALADDVVEKDNEINDMEVEVEEECLKILALHQPVAIDLRFIVAVLKINNDLERIGDLACNIAKRTRLIAVKKEPDVRLDLPGLSEKVQRMVKKCLDSLVNMDPALAREAITDDDEVDEINRGVYDDIMSVMRNNPQDPDPLVHLLTVSRTLERMADHATNIAEDVIYMIEGNIVRHKGL